MPFMSSVSRLDISKKNLSKLEGMTIETSKTESKYRKKGLSRRQNI